MEAATQAAEHIMALHITQTTRNLYKQRMNVVISFVRRHFPDSYDQTDINLRLPLPRDVLEAFFWRFVDGSGRQVEGIHNYHWL